MVYSWRWNELLCDSMFFRRFDDGIYTICTYVHKWHVWNSHLNFKSLLINHRAGMCFIIYFLEIRNRWILRLALCCILYFMQYRFHCSVDCNLIRCECKNQPQLGSAAGITTKNPASVNISSRSIKLSVLFALHYFYAVTSLISGQYVWIKWGNMSGTN